MYADFMWVAADQLFNQIAKARHMFGGERRRAVRAAQQGRRWAPATARSTPWIRPASSPPRPGWRIVAPSTPFDYVGLMNTALALQGPGRRARARRPLHAQGRAARSTTSTTCSRSARPPCAARVRTVTVHHATCRWCSYVPGGGREPAGVDADVIDLRWLDRASIDWETIDASIKKTNNVLIVEQGAVGTSYGGWLADEIQRRFFDWLDHPVAAGHRRRGVTEHQQGARAGRHRQDRGGRRRADRSNGGLICRHCCGCPASRPTRRRRC